MDVKKCVTIGEIECFFSTRYLLSNSLSPYSALQEEKERERERGTELDNIKFEIVSGIHQVFKMHTSLSPEQPYQASFQLFQASNHSTKWHGFEDGLKEF